MASSPTQRSMAELRKRGYTARIVEHWNAHANKKQDLFGFGDILAVKADVPGSLIVQTTTGSHLANRIQKAERLEAYKTWLKAGNQVEFHGWRKLSGRWVCRIETGTLTAFDYV